MIEHIRDLYAYDRWANRRILDAAERLPHQDFVRDLGSSFGSVRDTLVHVLGAEWVWLRRWQGTSPTGLPPWDLDTTGDLRTRWSEVEGEVQSFVGGLVEQDLDRRVAYRNTKGEPFESTMIQMLRHVVNHSTYHRGQVVTLLRQLGADAPTTDLILYDRERRHA